MDDLQSSKMSSTLDDAMDGISSTFRPKDEDMSDSSSEDTNMEVPQTRSKTTRTSSIQSPKQNRTTAFSISDAVEKGAFLPSQEEARQALQIVWQYFAGHSMEVDETLDMEEIAMMGRFMEKLKERGSSRGG